MSFRARLLLACLPLALLPLLLFGLRARQEVTVRLAAQDAQRVAELADVIEQELEREAATIAARLDRLAEAMTADNRFRLAVVHAESPDRAYVLDYAPRAMALAGLDALRIQDETGRVLGSGHFRNEYDSTDPELPAALARAAPAAVLAELATPAGPMLALVRGRQLRLGGRALTLAGGTAVDDRFLDRLSRGTGLLVELDTTDAAALKSADTPFARRVAIPVARAGPDAAAGVVVRAPAGPLDALRRDMDRWLAGALAVAAALAMVLAYAVAARLSQPLAELARRAGRVDLHRLDVPFATSRGDELGDLSRVLDRMTRRLRASTARIREAERRATIGDVARQVNHDVRNGLIPIRHIMRHMADVARERPAELPAVFLERQGTLDESVGYLESLAANYARLTPRLVREACDVNAVARAVAADAADAAGGEAGARVSADLTPGIPHVLADPVALRRILDNLVLNAVESLDEGGGSVLLSTRAEGTGDSATVCITVADTGRGMNAEERARIFDDFYTTKERGSGLGLAIVRRLVNDLYGRILVDSETGAGTRFTIELPAQVGAPAPATAAAARATGEG